MPSTVFDLIVDQGSDYELTVPVLDGAGQPLSLASWAAAGQVRASTSSSTILHTLSLTTVGTTVVLRIPAAASTAWTWRSGRYDVELTGPTGDVIRLLEGLVLVRPQVTR